MYPQNMVPDRRAAKVNMKVSVTVFDTHKAILLNTRSRQQAIFREVIRPMTIDPVYLPHS